MWHKSTSVAACALSAEGGRLGGKAKSSPAADRARTISPWLWKKPFAISIGFHAAILLAAIVAAIALTMRRRPETKYQNPGDQIRVQRGDRVRLVKMKSEKKL